MPGKSKKGGGLEVKSGFKLRSGNGPLPFKQMGSSPAKQSFQGIDDFYEEEAAKAAKKAKRKETIKKVGKGLYDVGLAIGKSATEGTSIIEAYHETKKGERKEKREEERLNQDAVRIQQAQDRIDLQQKIYDQKYGLPETENVSMLDTEQPNMGPTSTDGKSEFEKMYAKEYRKQGEGGTFEWKGKNILLKNK